MAFGRRRRQAKKAAKYEMHANALSCPLGQVVRPVFTDTFKSLSGRGYVKELDPGRFLVRGSASPIL
jgi:hypothetical protein